MEIWKEIPNYPNYCVSNLGRVKSFKRSKEGVLMNPQKNRKGYLYVSLRIPGKKKCIQIHRAVMIAFRPCKDMEFLEVNHKDEDKENNCLDNLEWVTHIQNVRYGTGHQRAVEKMKRKIRCVDTGAVFNSMREASETLGINYGNLSSCCSGRLKTANGLRFEIAH